MKNNELLNSLPKEVQEDVLNILKAYAEVDITYENGRYHFGSTLKASYAPDHKFIGTILAKDVYTETERIENYINEFKNYPPQYKGKRDHKLMREFRDSRVVDPETGLVTEQIGRINENGDFEITGTTTWKF